MNALEYRIEKPEKPPTIENLSADTAWSGVPRATLSHFHANSSTHHPAVRAAMLHDELNLYLLFDVLDRYVRSVQTEFNSPVCTDSCVELFIQPTPAGYFNFEINAGGTLHCSYIRDPSPGPNGFADHEPLPPALLGTVRVAHTLPRVVDPEIMEPTHWQIACQIPLDVLTTYTGPLGKLTGQTWRGNFFKCADHSSHPHWASWRPIGERLRFHQPVYFGELKFA